MPDSPVAAAKRALLFGIDKYQFAPKIRELHGCVNDALLMRAILAEQFGFPAENVTVLTNEDATRDRMLAALDALVAATSQEDIVVIYYAGHGSQMTDREGDEASGLDNTLMPVDSEGWSGVNRDITDDEVHLRLAALGAKTSYITIIVDACHSATITRDAFGVESRGIPADTRPIAELPPSPIPSGVARSASLPSPRGPSGWMPLADQYVLIAGCRDEETSFEYRPPEGEGKLVHGALTYFLAHELRAATSGTSYRDVFERAAARVIANDARQHPQMEGRADRALFGVADLEPMRYARVEARTGETVTLAAGAAHGMTVGSTWAVYPQGTKREEGAAESGTIEITSVAAVRADARVVTERSPAAIAVDSRAVERVHAYGSLRMRVQLAPGIAAAEARGLAAAGSLRAALSDSVLIELVGGDEPAAAARIYLIEPRTAVGPNDPVPQLGAVPAPVFAVVNTSGALLMPDKRLDQYLEVRENLERLVRARQALELENPDPASALRGKFELELLRLGPDGKWVVAAPDAAGGMPVFEEGDPIAFEIKSRHEARAFINLLDFNALGKVSMIFPAPNATDQITPQVRFQIGTDNPKNPFRVSIPKGYPFWAGGSDGPLDVPETVKLFVTTAEADFRFLQQQGVRAIGRPAGPLQLLWETAAGAAPVRDIGQQELPVGGEDWTTVVRQLVIRRKRGVSVAGAGDAVALGTATV